MALQKNIAMNTGVVANYHKIRTLNINAVTKNGSCLVSTYLNHQARLDDKKEIEFKSYSIPANILSGIDITSVDARVATYNYLKTLTYFNGAEDV